MCTHLVASTPSSTQIQPIRCPSMASARRRRDEGDATKPPRQLRGSLRSREVTGSVPTKFRASVARAADLPAGYTAVDAIVAPRGAYSDTGYKPNQNSRTMMDVTVQGAGEYWFGCWDRDYKDGAFAFCNDGNSIYAGYYSARTVPAKLGTDTNHRTANGPNCRTEMVQTAE